MLYVLKVVYTILFPPGLFALILLVLWLWLKRAGKKMRQASTFTGALLLVFYIFSTNLFASLLIRPLETLPGRLSQYRGDVIVVIGEGAKNVRDLDGIGIPSGFTANNLIAAVKLYHHLRVPLILSGGRVYSDSANEALVSQRDLMAMGVPKSKLILETRSRTTNENALNVAPILRRYGFHHPILIATSYHMKRAELSFAKVGIKVTPCPTNFVGLTGVWQNIINYLPTAHALYLTTQAIHEYVGMLDPRR